MQDHANRGGVILSTSRVIDAILGGFEIITITVASASLFLIMVLIFFDATLRYLFNSPLPFAYDLVTLYLMSAALLSVLSYTLRHGGHISIDLFANLMNRRVYLVLVGLALLTAMVVCGVVGGKTASMAINSWEMKEVMTGIYAWPLWIGKAVVAIGFIGLTARLFHVGMANLLSGLLGIPELEIQILHDPSDPEGEI